MSLRSIVLVLVALAIISLAQAAPIGNVLSALQSLGLTGDWAGQYQGRHDIIAHLTWSFLYFSGTCIQFGALNQATNAPFCIPYKSKTGPLAHFYTISYFSNGTTSFTASASKSLVIPGKPPVTATFPFSTATGQIVKMTNIPSSNPSNTAACLQVISGPNTISYVANVTKVTDNTGLVSYTYTESGIYNTNTQGLLSSCSGYKPSLFCSAKTFNYICNMTIAVNSEV
jgi:hypothetical protein